MNRALLPAALLALLPIAAMAQGNATANAAGAAKPGTAERPVTIPTRDVDVTYTIAGPNNVTLKQRLRWNVATQQLRIDPPGGMYAIVNYKTNDIQMVSAAQHHVFDFPSRFALPGTGGANFTKRGQQTVAGLACTNWDTTDKAGHPTTVCMTADGVMLQTSIEGHVLATASSVAYGAQDPAIFKVPAGYARTNGPPHFNPQ